MKKCKIHKIVLTFRAGKEGVLFCKVCDRVQRKVGFWKKSKKVEIEMPIILKPVIEKPIVKKIEIKPTIPKKVKKKWYQRLKFW